MPDLRSRWSADQTQAAASRSYQKDVPPVSGSTAERSCRMNLLVKEFTSKYAFMKNFPNPVRRDRLMDWRHRAICRDEDPELFFPIGNTGPALLQIEQAKTVCRRCPVVQECLAWALESGQDAGVWGGLSEDERRALKRRNARARARLA